MGSRETDKRKARRRRAKYRAAFGLAMHQIEGPDGKRLWRVGPRALPVPQDPSPKANPMSLPAQLASYESIWVDIATRIYEQGRLTLPLGNTKKAFAMRLKFYGFRKAYAAVHGSDDPLAAAAFQAKVTVSPEGHLVFDRDADALLMADALEALNIAKGEVEPPLPSALPSTKPPSADELFASLGYGTKADEDEARTTRTADAQAALDRARKKD
jgi:hypothetical protein